MIYSNSPISHDGSGPSTPGELNGHSSDRQLVSVLLCHSGLCVLFHGLFKSVYVYLLTTVLSIFRVLRGKREFQVLLENLAFP